MEQRLLEEDLVFKFTFTLGVLVCDLLIMLRLFVIVAMDMAGWTYKLEPLSHS
ncbi:hypothetical protein BDV59DRAFT_167976 [Aspergillus ambiguus]|uniref:uncharacterized protein n=1 Tax=Aspergillus ambiguus TaxID=176160 RepID=UPI003CCD44A4